MKKIVWLFAIPTFLFLANAVLVYPLFLGGYTQQIGSIEGVFIADARFIWQNFPNLSWNPYWYTGFPFHLFYTPLLPALMALFHLIDPAISLASWYRIIVGVFYAAIPVSFYFFVRYLTGKTPVGLLAALIFSFAPTLAYLMPQMAGAGNTYHGAPWRVLTLLYFGEGGHIMGLAFIPLALLFFLKAVRFASLKNVALAVVLVTLLALTNMIALIAFIIMLFFVLGVELLEGDRLAKLKNIFLISFFSFGLSAFWYNLSFIKASLSIGTGGAAGRVGTFYAHLLPLIFLLVPIVFLLTLLNKKAVANPFLISSCWVLLFFASALFWFNQRVMLLPQPNRYVMEMDMGVAIILAWGGYLLVTKIIPTKLKQLKIIIYAASVIILLSLPLSYASQVQQLAWPHQDISQTSEYVVSQWLEDHTGGERVYASGSTAFWLNTFADVPQIRGGNDGVAKPWILNAIYQINTGENAPPGKEGEVAMDWLRALNVSYLVVNTPASKEVFHDFASPAKFTQVKEVEEKVNLSGDIIYKVPLSQPSLAQVVKINDYKNLRPLKSAVDVGGLEEYVRYIDNTEGEKATFAWTGVGKARVQASLKDQETLALQLAFDPGWKAYVDGKPILLKSDVMGFIFLDPKKTGSLDIDLEYKRTWDVWFGYLLTLLTILGMLFYPWLKIQETQKPIRKDGDEE